MPHSPQSTVDLTNPIQQGADLALQFRQTHGLANRPIDSISELLSLIDADFIILDLPDGIDALRLRDPVTSTIMVGVATTTLPLQQRFTIAHEIGHVLSDDIASASEAFHCSAKDPCEVRANSFAQNLLCPEEGLLSNPTIQSAAANGEYLTALNEATFIFGVPPQVAMMQLKNAKLVPDNYLDQKLNLITAANLATMFGWQTHYQYAAKVSMLSYPSNRLTLDAQRAYQKGLIPLSALAMVSHRDPASIKADILQAAHLQIVLDQHDHSDPFAHLNAFFDDVPQ